MKIIIKIILSLITIITLLFNVINKTYNNYIVIGLLSVYLIAELFMDGYRRPNKRDFGSACLIIFLGCFLTMSLFYMFGTFDKFNRNLMFIPYKYIKTSLWLTTFITVILTEFVRYISMLGPKGRKKTTVLITILLYIIFVLIDINLAHKSINLHSFSSVYDFFAITLCASLTKNAFLMWITHKYGYVPCFIYVLIIDLYVYFLPVVPKINQLLQACMFMLLPFILYTIIDGLRKERDIPTAKGVLKRKLDRLETIVLLVVFAILAGLVSREFKYSMIAVGSESMTGTVDKGDAIIYKKYNGEILHEGDIIVFKMEGRLIVHRINKRLFYGEDYAFITKGDANDSADNWIVESNMIVGVVVQKVKYIAWPSVWINEKF